MSATTDRNLQKLPATPVDWVALYNDLCDKLELGFTIKRTAGEALAQGDPFYISSDGKAYKASDTTANHGVWQSTSTALGAEGFGTVNGTITKTGWTWTKGGYLYVNSSKALTQTIPNSNARAIGYALETTKIFIFHPLDREYIPTARLINTTSPLQGGGNLSADRTLSLIGLSGLGTANQIIGTNAPPDALEHKTIQGTTDEIEITHAAGSITLGNPSKSYASVQTTDATVTTLISKTLAEGKAYIIVAKVVGKQADTNRASYVRRVCVYRPAAGSATLQGSVQDELTIESDANWDCTVDVSGNDARVRITGVAATTIDWKGSLEFIEV